MSAALQISDEILERRKRYENRLDALRTERSKRDKLYGDLCDFILPELGRFLVGDVNQPKDTSKILNGVPTRMARSLAAGFSSLVTPQSRPWCELEFEDTALNDRREAKLYRYEYTRRLRRVLQISGFYRAMAMGVYPSLVVAGIACCIVEGDLQRVARFVPLSLGQYFLAQNGKGRVNTLYHEEAWSIAELVDEFGVDSLSPSSKQAFRDKRLDDYVHVLRVIEPNNLYDPGRADRYGKQFSSCWLELGGINARGRAEVTLGAGGPAGFLRESGFEEFPVMAPRWAITGRDVYGTGPGDDALPDAKQLMKLESRGLLALAKGLNPPVVIPESMRAQRLGMLPGDPIYKPNGTNDKVEPVYLVKGEWVDKAEMKARQAEYRCGSAFFSDLMAMFSSPAPNTGKQPVTAEEIQAKQQEKMLLLGPPLENVNDELLTPAIERVAHLMARRGLAPIAPRSLQGAAMKVRFTSVLHQAQKIVGSYGKERLLFFVGQVGAVKGPDAYDNIEGDKMIEEYADDIGVSPTVLADPSVVAQKREARAAQVKAQMMSAMAAQGAATAKDAAKVPMDEDNLMTRIAGPQASAVAGGGVG